MTIVSAAGCTTPPSHCLDAVMTQQTSVPGLLGDASVCTVGGGGENPPGEKYTWAGMDAHLGTIQDPFFRHISIYKYKKNALVQGFS